MANAYSAINRIASIHWEIAAAGGGMRRNCDTARLPNAMEKTNEATTMEKVKWEAPSASAPRRFSAVCSDIMAKPESSAAAATSA